MRARADSVLSRLAAAVQPRRPLVHLALSPWWARVLVAAGAQEADTSDSMTVNFPPPGEAQDTRHPLSHHGAALRQAGEQGLLFGDELLARPASIGYRAPAVCAAAGITYRQLDYWAQTGLVEPSVRAARGSESAPLYSFRDILVLKTVKRLLDTGISLQQIRAAVAHLRSRGTDDLAQVTLMSDGVSVYECTSSDEVVDLLQSSGAVFGIALGRIWQEVDRTLAELPAEQAVGQPDAPGSPATPSKDELSRRRAHKAG
jgi:DNA-binding transcriptional MerR regulator